MSTEKEGVIANHEIEEQELNTRKSKIPDEEQALTAKTPTPKPKPDYAALLKTLPASRLSIEPRIVKPSLKERLDLFPAILVIIFAAIRAWFSGLAGLHANGPKSLHLHVGYALLRRATGRLSPLQLQ